MGFCRVIISLATTIYFDVEGKSALPILDRPGDYHSLTVFLMLGRTFSGGSWRWMEPEASLLVS